MRNKIRQMMKKEDGFTLVELLAVIVILGIIVAIAVPAIGNVISRAETGADESKDALIVDAARLYMIDNDEKSTIDVEEDLINKGYLEVRTDDATYYTSREVKVEVKENDNGRNYTYEVVEK